MIKNRVIQFSLIIVIIILFFFTYYSKKNEEQTLNIDKNVLLKSNKIDGGIKNVVENAKYDGTNNKGTFFELNARLAEVFNDQPNLSNMKEVSAIITMKDGRKIYIKSDRAIYNKLNSDAKFIGNVSINESENEITSDNLDLNISNNLISAYNNVKYNGIQGILLADKVDIDIFKNEVNIFMFDANSKVKVIYNN